MLRLGVGGGLCPFNFSTARCSMADGGEKKKGSTRGGSSRKAKSGKRYYKNPWIDDKPKENGCVS